MTFQEALQLYEHKQYQEAVIAFQELVEQQDKDLSITSCYYLSKCFYNLHDEESRLFYLMNSFIYGYGVAEIYCELGFYYMDRKDYRRAVSFFQAARLSQRDHLKDLFLPEHWGYIPCLELSLCFYNLKELRQAILYNQLAAIYQPNANAVQQNSQYFHNLLEQTGIPHLNQLKNRVIEQRNKYSEYEHPGVSLITITNKSNYITTIFENYDRMIYPKKELIIVLNHNELNIEDYHELAKLREHIRVFQLDTSVSLGECLNYGISHASYDYIAKIDDDDFYGKHYLTDQMNCFFIPDISVVTKSIRFILFEQDHSLFVYHGHGESKEVIGGGGGTIVAKKSVFDHVKFHDVNCAEDHYFFTDCSSLGYKIYASDRFNYVYKRHISSKDHTFVINDMQFKINADEILFDGDFESVASV